MHTLHGDATISQRRDRFLIAHALHEHMKDSQRHDDSSEMHTLHRDAIASGSLTRCRNTQGLRGKREKYLKMHANGEFIEMIL